MSYMMKKTTLLFLLLLSSQSFGFITVGSGGIGVCDFDNLLDAYTASVANNDHFIRVTSEQTLHDTFVMTSFTQITGGYDNCLDADTNTMGTNLTQWNGDNTDTVVTMNVGGAFPLVLIENFRLFNGNNTGFEGAGGIKIINGTLTLINSLVESNNGKEGGGIQLSGSSSLTIQDSVVASNTATLQGGGLWCTGASASVTIKGDSVIKLNSTNGKGGGIYASNACQVTVNNSAPMNNPVFGINGNVADFGGGVYMTTGANMIISGSDSTPAAITDNISTNANAQFAGGGGVFLTGNGTTLTTTNTHISNNTAINYGAGMVVENSALITMKRLNTPCWDNDKCSSLSNNRVTDGFGHSAAAFLDSGGVAHINQTFISNNQANSRTVMSLKDFSIARLEGNLIVDNVNLAGGNTQSLFHLSGNLASALDVFYTTIASNKAFVLFDLNGVSSSQEIRVINSLIWDQGDIINQSGGNAPQGVFDCNLVHQTTTLFGTVNDTTLLYPKFIDDLNGNFHLASDSDARDLCGEGVIQSQFKDLNGQDRGIDDPTIPALNGDFEPGAYEYKVVLPDAMFSNGFE